MMATAAEPLPRPWWHRWSAQFKDRLGQGVLQSVVAGWMNLLICLVAGATVVSAGFLSEGRWPAQTTWGAGALKLFVLWCLAFLPGWLYIRFLRMRGLALWTEYVLVLHRLGWDRPWNLPEPPRSSQFFEEWDQQPSHQTKHNIYRLKFEAYYGRTIPAEHEISRTKAPKTQEDFRVRGESLFPVFMATAVFAVGWAACLWDTGFLEQPAQTAWVMLKYGFLGAYLFVLSMLVRRFFQSDLKPSAYATAILRIIVVLFVTAVLYQLVPNDNPSVWTVELAFAFLVGFFPLVGLQLIRRTVAKVIGVVVPPIVSDYPLDQLDGLNLWYESRLVEEGVEDMENLATMNLVDVVLHTRVPPGRLVDWIDQAVLLLRLGPLSERAPQSPDEKTTSDPGTWLAGGDARDRLRRAGIRGATDLVRAFAACPTDGSPGQFRIPDGTTDLPLPKDQLSLLVSILTREEGLTPVWNWKRNGVPASGTC